MIRQSVLRFFFILLAFTNLGLLSSCTTLSVKKTTPPGIRTGSVIFIHPDGTSLAHWGALRIWERGPDGLTNWDKLDHMGIYHGHQLNSVATSSNAGATAHAFGVKAEYDDYGIDPDRPVKSLSGKDYSIMIEAQKAGISTAVINSGHLNEPGTGVFLANVKSRKMDDAISYQIIHSGTDIMFFGGEVFLLPEGEIGFHGEPGRRKDGKNLIEEARSLGYTVIFTKEDLQGLPDETDKVLGIFSALNTYNDDTEEFLREQNLSPYDPQAPTVGEMTKVALRLLTAKGKPFLLVVEEEGTDNFSNDNNAAGTLEALSRADACIGVAVEYIDEHPNTLLVTAADSDAGGMEVNSIEKTERFELPMRETNKNGAPVDGRDGTATLPFIAAADKQGIHQRFSISWATTWDVSGGILARSHGLNSELLPQHVDNTDIYRMMYATLFGVWLP